ncbi:MAG: NAD-dependent dihydropyrimidine dehydrogenase subunit PreA [Candidatus Riflebacteria bacterium]|nr:NAD-dependent dihydropyrimidine dehydrogenase subunit PreA [Candidatus Riflebacteria bacterium]
MAKIRDLSINICGVKFPNPFLLSSSPVSNTAEMVARAFDKGWGGVAYKTIAHDRTRIIHPSPRMAPFNYENKSLVALQNVEQTSDRPMKDNWADIRWLKKHYPKQVLIVSIMGFSLDEWIDLARMGEDNGADMLELNFSCPHMTVEGAGMKVGQAMELIEKFTSAVKKTVNIPVIAKLTSNVTDITIPALYAQKGGADAITAINTVRALTEIGLDDFVPKPNIHGKGAMSGMSGPAIKPIGLKCVTELAQCDGLKIPIIGCGGAETWVDIAEYLMCGAAAIQVTTGIIHYGQRIVEDMAEGLSDWMDAKKFNNLQEIVGKSLVKTVGTDAFDLSRQGIAQFDLDKCIGCGQCYIVCQDAGGQGLGWDSEKRRPVPDDKQCLSCMICGMVCPVDAMVSYKYKPGKQEILPPVMG